MVRGNTDQIGQVGCCCSFRLGENFHGFLAIELISLGKPLIFDLRGSSCQRRIPFFRHEYL